MSLCVSICTYNDLDSLVDWTSALESLPTKDPLDIYVVNTDLSNPIREDIKIVCQNKNLFIEQSESGGYPFGAISHTFKSHPEYDYYIFLQDTTTPRTADWYSSFLAVLNKGADIVPWLSLKSTGMGTCGAGTMFDNQYQIDFLTSLGLQVEVVDICFGSVFAATNEAMTKLQQAGWLSVVVTNKEQCMAMERGVSLIFKELNLNVMPLATFQLDGGGIQHRLNQPHFPALLKKFKLRK